MEQETNSTREESEEEKKMKDEDLKDQINDIIEGEIQNGINEYLESQEDKEDTGLGFVSREDEAKELINETLYGRGVYGKKVDTIQHDPQVDYAVQVTPEGNPII